jgi:ParB-like nuclease domain
MPKKNKQTSTVKKPMKLKMPKVKTSKAGQKRDAERPALAPVTGSTTLAEIEELIAKSNGTSAPAVTQLNRDEIHAAELDVFQRRRPDPRESAEHIHVLVRALKAMEAPLKPILVFRAGDRFFAVDGHHRLAAYDAAEWKGPIPVEVFAGSLAEARMEALDRNTKDQLPMTQAEKREIAWQLEKENPPESHPDHLSIKDVINRLQGAVSEGTVKNMRAKWKEIKAAGDDRLLKMDWVHARRWPAKFDDAEDWLEDKKNAIYDRLVETGLAHEFSKYPDLAMEALTRINSQWPMDLLFYAGREAVEWVLEQYDLEAEASQRQRRERDEWLRNNVDKMHRF